MTEWKKVKLGEIAMNIQTGPFGSQLHQSDYSDEGTPVVMPKDIINGVVSEGNIARVSEEHVNRLARHKVESGDILYARRGDVGKCAFINAREKGWLCGTGCLKVSIDKTKANPKFVFFQLQKPSTIAWVKLHAKGATMPNLNTEILSEVPIDIPNLEEQNNIVYILSKYDSLIENYQQQIKLLEEAAQRLYKEWFVDLHFPGYENTKIVDGLPEGWEKGPLSSVIKIESGFAFKSKDFKDEGKYKIVTIKNVKDGNFDGVNVDKISILPNKMPEHCILKEGDILLSLTGIVGRVCFVIGSDYLLNQRVAKLSTAYRAFIYCLFRSREMSITLSNLSNGVAQQNLSPIKTEQLKILLPKELTLIEFENIVGKLLKRVINLSSQIRLLTEARDRLLPKLMSGEIAV